MACSKFTIVNLILGIFTVFLLTACLIVIFEDNTPETHKNLLNVSTNIGNAEKSPLKSTYECKDVCVSKECMYYSSMVLNSLDESEDKCANFYNYACGMYPRDTHHADVKSITTAFRERSESPMFASLFRLHEIGKFENPVNAKLEVIYNTCMQNISVRSEFKKLLTFLNSILGEWPAYNTSYVESDIDKWLSEFFLAGGYYFYTLELITDNYVLLRKVSVAFTSMLPRHLSFLSGFRVAPDCTVISRSLSSCKHGSLNDELMDLLTSNGFSEKVSNEILEDFCRIDRKIVKACVRPHITRIRMIEHGHWSALLVMALRKMGSNVDITKVENLFFHYDGMEEMQKLLDAESKTAIANYIALRFLYGTTKQAKFITTNMDFTIYESGIVNLDPLLYNRKQRCFAYLLSVFPFAFVKPYLRLVNFEKKAELLTSLYTDIRETSISLALSVGLSSNFRSTLRTTGYAVRGNLETLDYIKYVMNMWNDTDMLNDLSPYTDSLAMNTIESYRFQHYDRFLNHDHGRYFLANKHKNHFFAYASRRLSVELGFGLLQLPAKSDDHILINDYAVTGFILAHQLGDAVTTLLIRSTESNDVDSTYIKQLLGCLETSYNEFRIPYLESNVNGSITSYENSADFFALEVTYQALKKKIGDGAEYMKYPGLNQTFEELFFLFYANSQCEIIDRLRYKSSRYSEESPNEHRVNGPLMYSKGFSRVLKCPEESRMVPKNKCRYLL